MADDDLAPESRDESVARALVVDPLDEVTRRRLVSSALAASGDLPQEDVAPAQGTARARFFGVAAAAVAFVVLGVAALALPGGDTTDVATRAPQSQSDRAAASPEAAGPTPVTSGAAADAATAAGGGSLTPNGASADGTVQGSGSSATPAGKEAQALPDLGHLGDLSTPGSAARVVAAATPLVEGVAPQRWSFTFQECPARSLTVVATGLGAVDGHSVQLFVSRRDDGSLRVRALDGVRCELRSLP